MRGGKFKKVRKTGHFTAFQEEKYNDKNTFHLPRQEFLFCLNLLILCGLSRNKRVFYNKFTTFEKCSNMTKDRDVFSIKKENYMHVIHAKFEMKLAQVGETIQRMNEYKKIAIMDIIQSSNTIEKVEKFKAYKFLLSDCRIFLFDEKYSNFADSVKNKKIGKCGIIGIGDYTKTWILDSGHLSERSLVCVGKTIDFDLNIITYLNKIMTGRKINIDKNEFVKYLNYIKTEGFQIGITTALMERVRTKIDLNIFSEMITSFVKLDNISTIDDSIENIYLSEKDYVRIKQIYDMALAQVNENLEQFNIVCCCVMKAFLIKTYDNSSEKNKKVDMFIKYCFDVLNCYLEKEIVLLSLYIMDDNRTHSVFKKIKNNTDVYIIS